MNIKSLLNQLYVRSLRPILSRNYAFFSYRTFEMSFGEAVRKWKPDIIHAHDGVTLPTAARASKDLGAKLIFDSHELEAHRSPPLSMLRRRQVEYIERTLLPQADCVMTVTELAADYLAHEYRISRPVVLFNAPHANPQKVDERWDVLDRYDVRTDLYWNPRNFLFVYTGNVTLNRGLELAIIALSKLKGYRTPHKRWDDYHLAIVGKVQGKQDQAIIKLAKAFHVSDQIHFLPPVAPQRVAQYISTADASIVPIMPITLSYEYAMPNKLFEATLSGNPIICSDLLEMGTFVRDNHLGLTYQADSPDDCVEKMVTLINNYDHYKRSDQRQHELEAAFAWEAQEKKLLEMYDRILPLENIEQNE